MIANDLNTKWLSQSTTTNRQVITRFVALPHTEGCGCSGRGTEEIYSRTLLGYLTHPFVASALLMEHGCEKTHNDYMQERLRAIGLSLDDFGWASVQLDGGIDAVKEKVESYFQAKLKLGYEPLPSLEPASAGSPKDHHVGLRHLSLGLLCSSAHTVVPPNIAKAFAAITQLVVSQGGTVVLPTNQSFLDCPDYASQVLENAAQPVGPSLLFGQSYSDKADDRRGHNYSFHIMECPTTHWVEILTGLGATGVQLMLSYADAHTRPRQGNPVVPLLQITCYGSLDKEAVDEEAELSKMKLEEKKNEMKLKQRSCPLYLADYDLVIEEGIAWEACVERIAGLLVRAASQEYVPRTMASGNVDFQITRGHFGVSM